MPNPIDHRTDALEEAEFRERATMMLDAFERAEPAPSWAELRRIVSGARGVRQLRAVVRELRGFLAALSPADRRELDGALRARFGPDAEHARDLEVVAQVRKRGRIRSEAEYRVVQGYADAIAADAGAEAEFLALGALLDAYMAAP